MIAERSADPSASPPIPASGETSRSWANIGFLLSVVGVLGICVGGYRGIGPVLNVVAEFGFLCSPVCVLGAVSSAIGLRRRPRPRLAWWGLWLGIVGTLYLPEVWLFYINFLATGAWPVVNA